MKSSLHIFCALFLFSFVVKVSTAQVIFDVAGATETYITGINHKTEVCGYAVFPDGTKGFVKTATDTIIVEFTPGVDTWFGGINDQGIVVGRYNTDGSWWDYHCFLYNITTEVMTAMPQLDGYELLSPNDISNNGWISGDLKDGAQRRIFRYHEDVGMETDFIMIGPTVLPTYGGHDIREDGSLSGFYLVSGDYKGFYFDENLEWLAADSVSLGDPVFPNAHKTKLMGGNGTYSIINFGSSRTTYMFDHVEDTLGARLDIPYASEVYAMDMNDESYLCGYFKDAAFNVHGFFQAKTEIEFLPSNDGWNFVNWGGHCWNEDDYSGIDYSTDPYWLDEHGENIFFPGMTATESYKDTSFISWIDWVRAFGEAECYQTDPNVGYVEQSPNAYHVWKIKRKNNFTGICWGMVSNALLAYENLPVLTDIYPNMSALFPANTPASLDLPTSDAEVIAQCRRSQARLSSNRYRPNILGGFPLETYQLMPHIYTGLSDPQTSTKQVVIVLQGQDIHGQHALMPYKMDRDPLDINLYRIFVYDPNEPLNDNKYILVGYGEDFSSYAYDFGGTWTTWNDHGLRYDDWVENFSEPIVIAPITAVADQFRDGDVVLSLPASPDVSITGGQGGSIDVTGNDYSNTLINSETLFQITGQNEKPYSFLVEQGNYDVTVNTISDENFSAYFQTDEGTIEFHRSDSEIGNVDGLLITNNECMYKNVGTEPVNVQGYILTSDEAGTTYQYYCDNLDIAAGQSVGFDIMDPTHVMITSSGGSSTYDVRIRIFDEETGFWETGGAEVGIGSEVTQQLIPYLNGDSFDGIIVETDANQDGDFETSDILDNEGTPNMILSQAEVNVSAIGGTGTFYVSNVGSGNLNWEVVSAPAWITVTGGSTGVNHGPVDFTAEDNAGNTRQEWLIVQESAGGDQDSVFVTQLGANGIQNLDATMLMSMKPNPASSRVQFSKKQLLGTDNLNYEIFNVAGNIIASGTMNSNNMVIDVSEWSGGVYTVRFTSGNANFVMRLVVTK